MATRKKSETPATGEKKERRLAMTLAPQSERLVRRVARTIQQPLHVVTAGLGMAEEVVAAIETALRRLHEHFKANEGDPFKEATDANL